MAELKKKIRNRNTHASVIKKLLSSNIEDIYSNYTEEKLTVLLSCKDTLIKKFEKVLELNDEISEVIVDDAELEQHTDEATDFEIKVRNDIRIIEKFISKKSESTETLITGSTASSTSSQIVRLPKIEIKKFYGDPACWQTFIDSFESAVDDKSDQISDIEKMNYLVNLVKGEAEATVKGLTLSHGNYKVALDLLKARFADPQLLISAHMNRLLELETVQDISDATELRRLSDQVETNIRCLESLGLDPKSYGPLLIPIFMKKLPEEMKLIISREFDKVVWDIRVILEAFKREVQAREKLVLIKSSDSEQEYISKSKYSSGLILYQQVSRGSPKCVFCSKTDHKPQDCVEVSNVQRAAILKNSNCCFLCFRVGHIVRNCSAKFTCFNCKKRHHVAICQGKPHNLVVSEKQEDQGQSSVSSNIAAAQTGSVNLIHDRNNVLLQTARASVTSTVGVKKGNFRFLFDLGSQLSYISPRACEVLKLKTVANHNINIKTFGGVNSVKSLNQVRFCVKDSSGNESIYVTGFVSDICQPLTGQAISYATKTFNHLRSKGTFKNEKK